MAYDGLQITDPDKLHIDNVRRCPEVGDGNWYRVPGVLLVHFMQSEGDLYIDMMQVTKLSRWQRFKEIFKS